MEEGLEALKLAWTTRPFTYHGRHYNFDDVAVYPEPLQRPHPPLWVAATAPLGAERAGRHGANLQAASVDPAVFDAYRAGLVEGGHDPAARRVGNTFFITVTNEGLSDSLCN
jgi:alkanesulfonate monooxygenase SsuD/methylene tetrahydromethanopterin reductase-like flavin-dependent oxidoreductase (luciferase family)